MFSDDACFARDGLITFDFSLAARIASLYVENASVQDINSRYGLSWYSPYLVLSRFALSSQDLVDVGSLRRRLLCETVYGMRLLLIFTIFHIHGDSGCIRRRRMMG